ncbi:MAG TPA: hypothetical protein VMA75_01350 [Candidatus Paceibacterota bacterium]|nr:hypothetical protein [Candidatus Paceibacterota bacterium]
MKPLGNLEDLRPWCLEATQRDEEIFAVSGEIDQATASAFAGAVNRERPDHIWVEVVTVVCNPDPSTVIRVRCSA